MASQHATRVLIVENDELNAMLLQLQLESEGLCVVGVAATVAAAMQMLDDMQPQLAFLDYWLSHSETSAPIAEALKLRGIPFLVATGMDTSQLPAVFDSGIKLAKPYTGADLSQALAQSLATS
ncbi:response regulator [Stenotrophomonas sp.]|uniref:response regulator n=1 Tax=Stenotrophomonas sp. TaxID=69392 RepID=UPI0028A7C166|nr:response regulator [Stenotrophomonas sp.]